MRSGTCRDVAAFDEASQWTGGPSCSATSAIAAFPGVCRINRAEVMRFEGKLEDAERTASGGDGYSRPGRRGSRRCGYAEVGEVRLRLGDLAKAEEAFDQADALGRPEPGRSLLLAREKPAAALASIRRALADDLPALTRTRLLPSSRSRSQRAPSTTRRRPRRLAATARLYDSLGVPRSRERSRGFGLARAGRRAGSDAAAPPGAAALAGHERALRAARTRVLLARAYAAAAMPTAPGTNSGRQARSSTSSRCPLDMPRAARRPPRPSRTRVTMTFVFTDVVGSTRHLEHLGDANWQKLLRRHDELIRRVTAAEGGTVVDHTGDGFFLAFERGARRRRRGRRSSAGVPATCRSRSGSASTPPRRRASATTTAARASTSRLGSAPLRRRGDPRQQRDRDAAHRGPSERAARSALALTEGDPADPVDVVAVDWRGAS